MMASIGGAARTLPACRSHNAPVHLPTVSGSAASAGAGGSGAAAPPPPQLEFFKPKQSTFNNAGLANADTSYVLAYLARPPAADVVVVTAKAATFAPGSHPSPWPAPGKDVRYWSMCIGLLIHLVPLVANTLPGGGTDYGCRADEATRLNAAGDYAYVIGSESQRAAISRVPGVTFLPFSTTRPAGPSSWPCGTYWSAPHSRTRPRTSRRPATRRRPRPAWARTTRARRSARWRPSPPAARRHACGEQGSKHLLHYFYRR